MHSSEVSVPRAALAPGFEGYTAGRHVVLCVDFVVLCIGFDVASQLYASRGPSSEEDPDECMRAANGAVAEKEWLKFW
eukprot:1106618-Pleurochrysis_carterae.AAC.3